MLSMSLDIRTLYIVVGVSCFIVAGAFFFFQARQFRTDGVRQWSTGYAFQGIYWIFLALRGLIPDFFSIIVANTLLAANYSMLYAAVKEFQHRSYRRILFTLPTIVTFIFISFFLVYIDNFIVRTFYISLLSSVQMGSIALILFGEGPFQRNHSQWFTGCFFATGALLWFILLPERFIRQTHVLEPSIVLTVLLILGFGVVVLTSIGFLLMIRERAGEALKESGERLRLFLENAPAALAMFDRDMRYMSVSRRWLRDYDLGDRNLLGLLHYEVFPAISDEWKEVHRRGLAGEVLRAEADRFERADGSVQWVRWEIRPWRKAAGEVGGIVIFTEDITELKKAESLLQRYRLLAEHTRDIILFMRRDDGRLLEANASAVQAYGYTREELLALSIYSLRAPETGALIEEQLMEADRKGILFETLHRRKDGSIFPVEVSSRGETIDGIRTLISVVRDITGRRLTEDALKVRTSQLEAANKELESFSYSVSHDLRTPLRAIDGFSKMLAKDLEGKLDQEEQRKFNVISENTRRMGLLIDDLLSFSRLGNQPMSLSRVNVQDLVNQVWEESRAITPDRKMELIIGDLPQASGDSALLKQVLSNLLANAVKFSRRKKPAIIEIGGKSEGKEIVYYVKDNGTGFDMKYYDKLFGVFQRLHSESEYEGTGVGLAIVQRIIYRHGGRVWAEGKIGKGATFYFSLPAA